MEMKSIVPKDRSGGQTEVQVQMTAETNSPSCECGGHCDSCNDCHTLNPSLLDIANVDIQLMRNRSEIEAVVIDRSTGEILKDRIPVQFMSRANKLDYLSVSKIKAYEDCPACFYHQYMSDEGSAEDNSNFFTKFGTILHEVVELASKYYRDSGIVVNHLSLFDDVWKSHDLVDFAAYTEGKQLIAQYFANNPVDARPDDSLFIEQEWRGELGGCTFGLMVDYAGIMRANPKAGILKDYKTNRMPFTPSELDESFQLKIYEIILRRFLAPQVEQWTSGYEMFRYGWQQCPPRTPKDLADAEQYVSNVSYQISHDNTWEEKLNNYCGYRNCRFTCKKYHDYVNNPKRYIDVFNVDGIDYSALEKQRSELASYEKIAKTRKDECAGVLKTAIEQSMMRGEKFVLDGQELQLYSNGTGSYNFYETRNILLVNDKLNLLDECVSISKTKMDKAVAKDANLKLQLASCIKTNYASPYIVKKKV